MTRAERPVELKGVVALSETRSTLLCSFRGHRFEIARAMLGDSEVQKPGDRGSLVIPRWLATNLGIRAPRAGAATPR